MATIVLVAGAQVLTTDHKVGRQWHTVTDPDAPAPTLGEALVFTKLAPRARAGMMYQVEQPDADHVTTGSEKFLRLWPRQQDVVAWRLADEQFTAAREVERAEDAARADPLRELVAPLAALYQSVPFPRRGLFVARLIHYLNHPPKGARA